MGVSFFEVLMLLWCLFGVSGIVPKVLKMLVFFFPVLGAFVGWVIFVYLGLEGLGVLVFLCLFFCVGFVSVLFALFLFSCWIVFCIGSCFVFVFFFFAFVFLVFFGGFKGQVRWPKRATSLGPKPSLFYCLVFCFCFSFFVFVFCFRSLFFCFFLKGLRAR